MELSCSPPLSVNFIPNRRFSVSNNHRRCQKVFSLLPNYPAFPSNISTPTTVCSSCSSSFSSYFGSSLSQRGCRKNSFSINKGKRSFYVVSGVFERFTERAIKAVMFSQREAKALGKDMVFTQHLLLGLVAEDRDPAGFLGSGIRIDAVREAVRSIWQNEDDNGDDSGSVAQSETSSTDVPFSVSTKRVFEAAVEYSKTMGYNFIAPEHIWIGLFTVDDGSAGRVLKRYTSDV